VSAPTAAADRRPRFCYLVFCHRQPELIVRMARAVTASSSAAEVVLRHDRPGLFDGIDLAPRTRELVSTTAITWGSWAMVAAQLEALEWVREHVDPDWTVLISGQDYPVRDLGAWEDEVVASGVNAWVAARPLDPTRRETRTMDREDWLTRRYTYRWTPLPRTHPQRWAHPFLRRATRAVWYRWGSRLQVGWAVNEMPRGLPWMVGRRLPAPARSAWSPWYGEQWMAMDRAAASAVRTADARNRAVRQRFERSLIPDESYFQTLVCSDPTLTVADRSLSWKHFTGSDPHPRAVTVDDVETAGASGRPFVRKVDLSAPAVLDRLDAAAAADRRTPTGHTRP